MEIGDKATYCHSRGLGSPLVHRGIVSHITKNSIGDPVYWVEDENGRREAGVSGVVKIGHLDKYGKVVLTMKRIFNITETGAIVASCTCGYNHLYLLRGKTLAIQG